MAMSIAAARSATSSVCSRIPPVRHSRAFFTARDVWNPVLGARLVPPFNLGAVFQFSGTAFIVERFGKYHKTLTDPGWHFLIPFVDRVTHVYAMAMPREIRNDLHFTPADQTFVVSFAYVLAVKYVDPKLASYTVKNTTLETQRAMDDKLTSEILTRFNTVNRLLQDEDRRLLCQNALSAANTETSSWGVKCVECNLGLPSIAPEVACREMKETKLMQVLEKTVLKKA